MTANSAKTNSMKTSHAPLRGKDRGVSVDGAYRLSRIQAEGWNAAHRLPATAMEKFDASKIQSLNPYASDPERARWTAGFTSAFKS